MHIGRAAIDADTAATRHAAQKLRQAPFGDTWNIEVYGPAGEMLRALRTAKKMGLPMDNVVVTVQDHGNTSAASIPLALSVGKERGQIKQGDLIVTEAIGGGLAWGAVVLRW